MNKDQMNRVHGLQTSQGSSSFANAQAVAEAYSKSIPRTVRSRGQLHVISPASTMTLNLSRNSVDSIPRTTTSSGMEGILQHLNRSRHRTTVDQQAELERIFEHTEMPDVNMRVLIAERLNMPIKSVHIWFQNRRAKARMEEKSKEQTVHGSSLPPPSGNLDFRRRTQFMRPLPSRALLTSGYVALVQQRQAAEVRIKQHMQYLASMGTNSNIKNNSSLTNSNINSISNSSSNSKPGPIRWKSPCSPHNHPYHSNFNNITSLPPPPTSIPIASSHSPNISIPNKSTTSHRPSNDFIQFRPFSTPPPTHSPLPPTNTSHNHFNSPNNIKWNPRVSEPLSSSHLQYYTYNRQQSPPQIKLPSIHEMIPDDVFAQMDAAKRNKRTV